MQRHDEIVQPIVAEDAADVVRSRGGDLHLDLVGRLERGQSLHDQSHLGDEEDGGEEEEEDEGVEESDEDHVEGGNAAEPPAQKRQRQ